MRLRGDEKRGKINEKCKKLNESDLETVLNELIKMAINRNEKQQMIIIDSTPNESQLFSKCSKVCFKYLHCILFGSIKFKIQLIVNNSNE